MADFISREAAEQLICETCELPCPRSWLNDCEIIDRLNELRADDVVARDCYDRILSENDTMRKQLAQIGKKPGDRMDDVRPVVLCRDCRYFYNGYDEKCCINHKGVVATDENGFCHHAKRRYEDG